MTAVALQPVVLGAASYGLVVAAPLGLFWLLLRVPGWAASLVERRAVRRFARSPHGRPLELLAADVRRLRAEVVADAHGSNVRRAATIAAYDAVLCATCDRLGLAHGLRDAADDDRELERLRAEAAIERAGVPLTRAVG